MTLFVRAILLLILVSAMAGSAFASSGPQRGPPMVSSVPSFFKSPLAAFTYIPRTLCMVAGELAFFNAHATVAIGHSIVSYVWDFRDGSAELQTPSPYVTHDFLGYPRKRL